MSLFSKTPGDAGGVTPQTIEDAHAAMELHRRCPAARHETNIRRAALRYANENDLTSAKALAEAAQWIRDRAALLGDASDAGSHESKGKDRRKHR